MKSFTLGLRNILRNRRRTLLTALAIVSGVAGIIVFGGFIEFTFQGLREGTIRTQLGHVQIFREGYSEKGIANPAAYLIADPQRVEAALAGLPFVLAVTRRLSFSGLISNGNRTVTCRVVGVMPEREAELAAFDTVLQGRQLDANMPDGAVIGKDLAKALNAHVGDNLTILVTAVDGVINAIEVDVVGIAQTGSQDYDNVFVKLPLPMAQKALATTAVEKILVLLERTDRLPAFLERLPQALAAAGLPLEYRRWDELAIYYRKVVSLYRGFFGVIEIIIGIVVLFSVANTMTMSVYERIREIGTLRAIGANRFGIMRLFLTEGLLLGIMGGLLGILTGIGAALLINALGGLTMPAPPGMSRGYLSEVLIVPSVLFYSFLLTVAVAVFSSIWPAWKASQVNVVEALAHT